MRVLAFDPGFERLGTAVVEKKKGKEILLYSGCSRTPKEHSFPERLHQLGEEAQKLIAQFVPDYIALENLYFEKNAKTAMHVAEVRGMLIYIAAKNHLPSIEYTPLQVKIATTGYGKSDKRAVSIMIGKLIKLPAGKRLDDEIDAIAIGLTALWSLRGK